MAELAPQSFLNRAADLLESPEVQAVDFELGHVRVSPERFRLIAQAIRERRVGLVFDPVLLSQVKAEAAYDPQDNRLILTGPDMLDDVYRSGFLVHEAVHAGTDMASRQTSLPLEEAGAFIAQIWYVQNLGVRELRNKNRSSRVFWRVALALRVRANMEPRPIEATPEQVSDAWLAAVRAGYPQIQFNADGI